MSEEHDPWPIAPKVLEDPQGAGSAWFTRAVTAFAILGMAALVCIRLPKGVLAFWRTGQITKDLVLGGGFVIVCVLLWLNERQKKRKPETASQK